MQTHAFRMQLNPGAAAEYQRRHDALWPELAAALKAAGVSDYWIFLDAETQHLFAVLKAAEGHRMDDLPTQSIVRQWWDYMADLMATAPDHTPLQVPLQALFHLP